MEEGGEDDVDISLVVDPVIEPAVAVPTPDAAKEEIPGNDMVKNEQPELPAVVKPVNRLSRKQAPKNNIVFEEWHCPNCDKFNYIGRSHCKRCQTDAPPSVALKRKKEAPTPMDEVEAIIASTLLEVTGMDDGHHRADLFQMNMLKGDGDGSELEKDYLVHEGEVEKSNQETDAETVDSFIKDEEDRAKELEKEIQLREEAEKLEQEKNALRNIPDYQNPEDILALIAKKDDSSKDKQDEDLDLDISHYTHLNESFESSLTVTKKWLDDLEPGNILISDIQCSSFEIRWEPPEQDRQYDSYRVSILDQDRHVLDIITTKEKFWNIHGLDPGCKYHITVTCRAMVLAHEEQPNEALEEFFLPSTTIKTTVRTKKQKSELAYWFDNQVNSPFHYRPFKLYLGTVDEKDGKFKQETKLGVVEMAVRYGLRGSSQFPAAAKVGYTCYELFSPFSLGVGAHVDFEVEQAHRSVYEIELWVKQHNPVEQDYDIAPDHVKVLALKLQNAEEKVKSLLKLKNGEEVGGDRNSVDHLVLENGVDQSESESNLKLGEASVISIDNSTLESTSLPPKVLQFNDSSLDDASSASKDKLKNTNSNSVVSSSYEPSVDNALIPPPVLHSKPVNNVITIEERTGTAASNVFQNASESLISEVSGQKGEVEELENQNGGDESNGNEVVKKEEEETDPLALAVKELASARKKYLSGGTYLHVRDRVDGSFVNSAPATKIGEWEKLTLRTAFKSNKMRFHVQVPAKFFGSVLIDCFKVTYMGPSELEIKIRQSMQWLEWGKGARTQALQVEAICVEDLITASGSRISGPVLCKFHWNGQYLEQTDVALGGIDPQFHNSFRVPLLVKKKHLEEQQKKEKGKQSNDKEAGEEEHQRDKRAARRRNQPNKQRDKRGNINNSGAAVKNKKGNHHLFGRNKPPEFGMRVDVLDALTNSVVGRLSLTEEQLLQLAPAPTTYDVSKKHKKAKGCCAKSLNCICGCICSVLKRGRGKNKDEKDKDKKKMKNGKVVPEEADGQKGGEEDASKRKVNRASIAAIVEGEGVESDFSTNPMVEEDGENNSSVFEDDSMSQVENGIYKRNDDNEYIYTPRGRVVLSVSKLIDIIPEMTDEDRQLVNIRNGLIRKEKKIVRQLLKEVQKERSEVEGLDFKCKLIRFGIIDVSVSLLPDHTLGPIVAEILILWTQVSSEVDETQGGNAVRRLLRFRLHKLGVAHAVFMSSRTKVRKNKYNALNRGFHFNIQPELLKLLCEVYISNRMLLLEAIMTQIDIFEMLVRCIPDPYEEARKAKKHKANSKAKEAGQLAGRLLEEVGLGKTLPDEIMFEYYRLRRIIPLDEKFWTCEQLYSLPMTIPKRIIHIYDNDRMDCLPPDQPEMSPWEQFLYALRQCALFLFMLIVFGTIAMAFLSLLRNGITCSITLSAMVLGLVSCCSVIYLKMISKMVKLGVGSQITIICCPFVCCNALCLIAAVGWVFLLLFISTNGLDQCDIPFLYITRLLLGCIGLVLARTVIQYLIIQGSRFSKFIMLHCCCCLKTFYAKSRPSSPIREADLKDFV